MSHSAGYGYFELGTWRSQVRILPLWQQRVAQVEERQEEWHRNRFSWLILIEFTILNRQRNAQILKCHEPLGEVCFL